MAEGADDRDLRGDCRAWWLSRVNMTKMAMVSFSSFTCRFFLRGSQGIHGHQIEVADLSAFPRVGGEAAAWPQ